MVVWLLFAIPVILIFGAIGMVLKSPKDIIMNKILFEFKQYERAIVYRFGKFHRVAQPGWNLMIPFIDKFVKYDLRTEAVDIPPQEVITKDAIRLVIDALLYIKVVDPLKAELEVEEDYRKAVTEFVKGRIRNIVGRLELDTLYAEIININEQIKGDVIKLVSGWGVEVVTVEIIGLIPPQEVVDALQAREIAERYKEAAKEEAETTKIRISAINDAAGKLTTPALNYLYLKALKDIADGKSSKIIFPMEFTKLAEGIGKGIGTGLKAEDLEKIAAKYFSTK